MDINLLFKIAAIGILVAVLHQVLVRAEAIETDSGYVITHKGAKGNGDKKRAESTGNMHRSQA